MDSCAFTPGKAEAAGLDLVADIGGTNARLALSPTGQGELRHVRSYECRLFAGPAELIGHYLRDVGQAAAPLRASLAVATAVTQDSVSLTNLSWTFSQRALQSQLGLERLVVINDFTALALSLTALGADDVHQIGAGCALSMGPRGLVGAGTGLGVSGLLPDGTGGWVPIAGEGGHATVAPSSDLEAAIVAYLKRYFTHVSAERVLSGPGLVNLYTAICYVNGTQARELGPAEVLQLGEARQDTACDQALDCFCSFLGGLAGNWALGLGATGGVYVGGGIAPRLIDRLSRGGFRKAFESKGRLTAYLESIPTWVITAPVSPALSGAATALAQRLRQESNF